MNEYDSDKMADVLGAAQGYEQTQDIDEADLVVFNTCSVREKAQEKVFSDLGRVKHLKKKEKIYTFSIVHRAMVKMENWVLQERKTFLLPS